MEQHEAKMAKTEALVSLLNQHELKINEQQIEIDQLKKKNLLIDDGTSSCDVLPRSCFEIKATNPGAQSGVYSLDPDGQIGGDQPIQAYCDMETRNAYKVYLLF